MESRFGTTLDDVRIHSDVTANGLARDMDARAFTIGRDIFFGAGELAPDKPAGRHLLAHELAHVLQQRAAPGPVPAQPRAGAPAEGEGATIELPSLLDESPELERRADASASLPPVGLGAQSRSQAFGRAEKQAVQRARVPLPSPVPLCGRTLTHIDVEPPRWRDLQPCLPASVPVFRANIVGRQVSAATLGRGRIIFNLHIGYYRDPATGRLCVIADDSMACVIPRCVTLGCFLTLREVFDAIKDFLKKVLDVLGIVALVVLAIILAILGARFLRGVPVPGGGPVLAEGGNAEPASEPAPEGAEESAA